MNALDSLKLTNGLQTTQSVLNKQQSGVDAAQKANPQVDAAQMNMNTAQTMLHGNIPIVKKEEPKVEEKPEQPKRMSYADMFKALKGGEEETPDQKARREKRERTRMRIAAVGDGLRALSNMYFATKGAKVVHNPESDMTPAMLKRKQLIDEQRKKNESAWLTGYQKALALNEEARKNDATLAEQVRYHNQLAKNRERVGDQKDRSLDQTDTKLDQNQQKIDLSKLKYTDDADYKKKMLEIKTMLANGQISHWGAQDAMSRLREGRLAAKANDSSGGNKTTAGYWYEYYDMMDSPEGQEKINELKRKLRIKNVTQSNVRYLMDRLKGRYSEGAPSSGGGKAKTAAKGKGSTSSNGSSSSNAGKKKSTGVKW